MSKSQSPKSGKVPEATSRTSSPSAATSAVPVWNAQKQLAAFDSAIKVFHARKFKEAREHFEHAAKGPERDVAQRARLHITMCESRLQKETGPANLGSAEDHYTYGVAMLNARNFADAAAHFEKGLHIEPEADHIHYALALAQALGGNLSGAHDHLRRAIEIEPRNRVLARQDTDFAPLANQPPLDSLIYPEKKAW